MTEPEYRILCDQHFDAQDALRVLAERFLGRPIQEADYENLVKTNYIVATCNSATGFSLWRLYGHPIMLAEDIRWTSCGASWWFRDLI